MSDFDTHHARHHGRALDYTDTGSGKGLWIGIAIIVVLAIVGLVMGAGGGGTGDGTATLPSDPAAIQPAAEGTAPATATTTAN